ncbi:39888_t:CDS:1, partial [Gigaspora margarita]
SLIIEIETKNIYANMIEDVELYDFSDYSEDYPLFEKLSPDQ